MNDKTDDPPAADRGLRRLMLRGSAFEVAGYGMNMVLRLAGNVALSRLLFPKAFGLSAEINLILYGLTMLSDVGILQCFIQSPRGDDENFINTAFTMQLVRGCGMCLLGVCLAFPIASLWFREPELGPLLAASCFQEVILGLRSTSVLTLRRRLHLGWLNAMNLTQQVIGLAVTITWAFISPSPWAIVGGGLAGAAAGTIISHCLPVGYRNRFHWDRTAYKDLSTFGRWIFGSSAIFFFGAQGDRALLGRLLGAQPLGVYQIGYELSTSPMLVASQLTGSVLYPALSRLGPSNDVGEIRRLYYRSRLALDAVGPLALGVLSGVGGWIVRLIWDSRYWGAGWMVSILCARAALNCLVNPAETCLAALGLPRFTFWRSVARALSVWIMLPIGYRMGGMTGLIWATVASEVPALLVLWPKLRKLGILRFERELLAVALFVFGLGIGTALNHALPEWHLSRRH